MGEYSKGKATRSVRLRYVNWRSKECQPAFLAPLPGKDIPTDFFVINASDDEHESIILGKPFLKLVNAILDVGKGTVTFDLDGEKRTFEFHSKPSRA